MRIDKFLKLARVIKRRTIAKEICDKERVSVNDRVVKASYEVCVGDIVQIRFVEKPLTFEVLQIMEHVPKGMHEEMIRIIP